MITKTTSAIAAAAVFFLLMGISAGTNDANAVNITFSLGEEDTNMITDKVGYKVENFALTETSREAPLCPEGNTCTYELDGGEFRENSYDNAYVLEGTLQVKTTLADGSTSSDNYDLWGNLNRENTVERDGEIISEKISGDVNIDRDYAAINLNPDYSMHLSGDVNMEKKTVSLNGVLS
jgi:hypothetical protein